MIEAAVLADDDYYVLDRRSGADCIGRCRPFGSGLNRCTKVEATSASSDAQEIVLNVQFRLSNVCILTSEEDVIP